MHFLGTGLAHHLDDLGRGRAAHDRVVYQHHALAFQHGPDRVVLAEQIAGAGSLRQFVEDRQQVVAVGFVRVAAEVQLVLVARMELTSVPAAKRSEESAELLSSVTEEQNDCVHISVVLEQCVRILAEARHGAEIVALDRTPNFRRPVVMCQN